MNKSVLPILWIVALWGCREVDPALPTPAVGDPITQITVRLQEPARSRVGVEVDPSGRKDTYFWTEEDALVLCELDEAGTAFTGNNYSYGIKSAPTTHGQAAVFEGMNAVTTGRYVVLHTRDWSFVSLPAAGGTIGAAVPWLEQRGAPTTGSAAAQAFADRLFFSTAQVTGAELSAGQVTLLHQWVQVEVAVTGQAADNGKRIRRVELLPETAGGYAQSIAIDPTGTVTATGGGTPTTYVTDPSAQLGTPYKVRLLARPTSLTADNGASVRVHCGLEYSAPSAAASATTFEPGSVYTLAKQVGAADQPIAIETMGVKTYVGAFWRNDQIGERLIHIEAKDGANLGQWTASVAWTDGRWPEDDILIQTGPRPIDDLDGNYKPLFDSTWNDTPRVTTPGSVAKGTATVSANGASLEPIFFRIGLKSSYTPTPDAPARYAVVLLSYHDNTKYHLIYLRQGEAPAPIGTGSDVRWSVYNVGESNNPNRYRNGGFTAFPSQVGFFKRWSAAATMYSPTNPTTNKPAPNWDADNSFASLYEVCPAGYKTPSFLSAATGDMASLFVGTNLQENRYLLGYYADGFFDRGRLSQGLGSTFYGEDVELLCHRSEGEHYDGYQGALVVNSTTRASLFFPCSGYRRGNSSGQLFHGGAKGYYWSSSSASSSTTTWHALYFDKSTAKFSPMRTAYDNHGSNIRCVKQ